MANPEIGHHSPAANRRRAIGGGTAVLLLSAAVLAILGSHDGPPPTRQVPRIETPQSPYENTRTGVAYIGDAACAQCHPAISEAYRRHPMGRSMTTGAQGGPVPTGVVFSAGDLDYEIATRGDEVVHRERQRASAGDSAGPVEAVVAYVLGSGTRGAAYLVQKGDGLFQSPIAWYAAAHRWDFAPGYRVNNLHFNRPITAGCLYCHANRVELVEGKSPVFHGLAIGCERCHGPGSIHAERPGTRGAIDMTIVNPAHLSPTLRDSVCEQCHLQGTQRIDQPGRSEVDFRPGLPFDAFVYVNSSRSDPFASRRAVGHVEQLRNSACAKASGGRLGCISCHDPHGLPDEGSRVAYYRDRCLQCHGDRGCSLPATARLTDNPLDDCIRCHMPRVPTLGVDHTALTHHDIKRPPPPNPVTEARVAPASAGPLTN